MLQRLPQGKLWKSLLFLQVLIVLGITIKTMLGGPPGHYAIFTTAGKYLLQGKNPYGVEWGFGGLWFYSPLCGWFFGLLSLMPFKVGLLIFNLGSHLLILEGVRRFLKLFPDINKPNAFLSLLVVLSTGELIGAYQSIKIEMAMIGILLIVTEQVSVRPILAASLAALIVNFKWFPAAPVGLLAIASLRHRKFKFPLALPIFFLFFFLLPVFIYGWSFALELYRTQHVTLDRFVSQVYGDFPSVFGMVIHTFNIMLSPVIVAIVMGLVAIILAGFVVFAPYQWDLLSVISISLGSLYVVNFNLLSQFNAYAIATPALAYTLFLCFSENKWKRYLSILGVAAYWMTVSMFYSDLVPLSFRDFCREIRIKPLGSLILLTLLLGLVGYDIVHRQISDSDVKA